MKRALLFGVLAIFLISFVSAQLTIISPTENQEFDIGEVTTFEISSDEEFDMVVVSTKCSGDIFWNEIYKHFVPTGEVTAFADQIKIGGFGIFYCDFKVEVADIGTPDYSPQSAKTVIYLDANPDQTTLLTRNMGGKIYPGGWAVVNLFFSPQENYTGLIINENLSNKLRTPAEQGEDPINTYSPSTVLQVSGGNFDWDYLVEENMLKFLLMSSGGLESNTISYIVQADNDLDAGEKIYFEGDWKALEDTGVVGGKQYIEVSGDYTLPGCPITDQQLLLYIDQWSKKELDIDPIENDNIIMQVIEVWKNCE